MHRRWRIGETNCSGTHGISCTKHIRQPLYLLNASSFPPTRFCETSGSSYPHISRRLSKPALLVLSSISPPLPCSFSLSFIHSPSFIPVHTRFRDITVSVTLHPHSPNPSLPHNALGPTLIPLDLFYASYIPVACTTRLTFYFSSLSLPFVQCCSCIDMPIHTLQSSSSYPGLSF